MGLELWRVTGPPQNEETMATKKSDKKPEADKPEEVAKPKGKAKGKAKPQPNNMAKKYPMNPPARTRSMGVIGSDGALYKLQLKDGLFMVPAPAVPGAKNAGCTRHKG